MCEDGAKSLQLHRYFDDEDRVFTIRYNESHTADEMDLWIRAKIGLALSIGYFVVNKTDKMITLDGSTPQSTYWLMEHHDDVMSDEELEFEDKPHSGSKRHSQQKRNRTHVVLGHEYVAKHFHTVQMCVKCCYPMFGMGMQGYHCKGCGATVHKRCHMNYIVPCGISPESFLKCANCKNRYTEAQNNSTACRYHTNFGNILCKQCKQPPYRSQGCIVGAHIPRTTQKQSSSHVKRAISEETFTSLTCDCKTHLERTLLDDEFVISFDRIFSAYFGMEPVAMLRVYEQLNYQDVMVDRWHDPPPPTETATDNTKNTSKDPKDTERPRQVGTLSYTFGIHSALGEKQTHCLEKQEITWRPDRRSFTVSIQIPLPEAPFANPLTAVVRYCITATSNHSSRVSATCGLRVGDGDSYATLLKEYLTPFVDGAYKTRADVGMKEFADLLIESLRELETEYMSEQGLSMTQVQYDPDSPTHSDAAEKSSSTTSRQDHAENGDLTSAPLWQWGLLLVEVLGVIICAVVLISTAIEYEASLSAPLGGKTDL